MSGRIGLWRAGTVLGVTVTAVLASCASPHDPFYDTALGQKSVELYRANEFVTSVKTTDGNRTAADFLADAAFAQVGGMDAATAIRTFEADGATCTGTTCLWTAARREPLVCSVGPCLRQRGPLRSWLSVHEVTLEADPIRTRADISAQAWNEDLPRGR